MTKGKFVSCDDVAQVDLTLILEFLTHFYCFPLAACVSKGSQLWPGYTQDSQSEAGRLEQISHRLAVWLQATQKLPLQLNFLR